MQEQAEKQHPPSSDEKEAGSDTPPAGHDTPLASHDPTPAGPPRQLSGALWAICVTSILIALFLFALDNTIVALVQPAIVHSLGHIEKLAWLSVSFALGSVATNLLWYVFSFFLTRPHQSLYRSFLCPVFLPKHCA